MRAPVQVRGWLVRSVSVRAGLVASLLALAGCPSEGGGKGRPGGGRGEAPPAVAVAVARLEPVEERLIGHAALEAEALVDVTCKLEGQVQRLLVEEGQAVAEGAVLAELDPTRAQLRLRDAELALTQAENTLGRRERMFAQGLSSEEERDGARTALAQAQLTLAQAKLDRAEVSIKSPRAGVVVERATAVGANLRVGDVAFRIADRDPLLAKVRIPEAQAERVKVGQQARVRVEGRAAPLVGEVIRVAPRVELESGTVIATVALHEGTEGIRLNRFATVELIVDARPRALTIPLDALAVRGREDQVLVAVDLKPGEKGQTGRAALRAIRVGVRQGERIEVVEGLAEGDQVIVAAPDDLRSDAPIRVLPAGETASVASGAKGGGAKTGAARRGPKGGAPH